MERFTKKFAQIVPTIREMDKEVLKKQQLSGKLIEIEIGGRKVETYWHRAAKKDAPLILEFHGGGMVLGYAAADDAIGQSASEIIGATVVNVDYCCAPEHPYPAAIEEISALIDELLQNKERYDIAPAKLALMGFSAGANIATAVAMRLNARPQRCVDALLLHYPIFDLKTNPTEKPPQDDALPDEVSKAFNELYCGEADPSDPYISPMFAVDSLLRLLPPAVIVTAAHDGLSKEGREFAERLKALGIEVDFSETPEASHGYIEDYYNLDIYKVRGNAEEGPRYEALLKYAKPAFEASCEALKKLL